MELRAGLTIELEPTIAAGMTIACLRQQPAHKYHRTKLSRQELRRQPTDDGRALYF